MVYLAIIWFGFHMVWKIMQIVKGFIRRGRGLTIDLYFKNMLTSTPGGGGVLPNMGYIGLCGPKG